MNDADKTIDDFLFKRMPKDVQRLNKQSRKEARERKRAAWAAQNPERIPKK